MKNILMTLALIGLAWPVQRGIAQDALPHIEVQATPFKVGEKIVVSLIGDTIPDAETSLHWTLPPTVQSEAGSSDGRRLLLWAPPGLYDVKARVSYTLDVLTPDPADPAKTKVRKVTFPPYEYATQFKVEGSVPGPTPPEPEPGPKPPGPDVPLTGLAALVPDKEKRMLVAEFYEDLAAGSVAYVSTGHFRTGYRAAIAAAQGSNELPKGIAALDKPISDRITAVIGLADVLMDSVKQAALAAELNRIAKELRQ